MTAFKANMDSLPGTYKNLSHVPVRDVWTGLQEDLVAAVHEPLGAQPPPPFESDGDAALSHRTKAELKFYSPRNGKAFRWWIY